MRRAKKVRTWRHSKQNACAHLVTTGMARMSVQMGHRESSAPTGAGHLRDFLDTRVGADRVRFLLDIFFVPEEVN